MQPSAHPATVHYSGECSRSKSWGVAEEAFGTRACLSVLADGRRTGLVFLGQTMSDNPFSRPSQQEIQDKRHLTCSKFEKAGLIKSGRTREDKSRERRVKGSSRG